MKKFFSIVSLLMIISLPILFSPCLLNDVCRWPMNFLWAELWFFWIMLLIIWFLLYNIMFFINNRNDTLTNFQKIFYKKSIIFVLVYIFIIISFLIWNSTLDFIINYWMSWFIATLPYLWLYLFLIPLIRIYNVINSKSIQINKYF